MGAIAHAKKILIVEDDLLLSAVKQRFVQNLGHQAVGTARTAEEAIEKTQSLQPDLIIMDIKLIGEMDGIQAMKKIREISDVPVIYLSGVSDEEILDRAEETKFVDFLVKPITSSDLEIPIERAFSGEENPTLFGIRSTRMDRIK